MSDAGNDPNDGMQKQQQHPHHGNHQQEPDSRDSDSQDVPSSSTTENNDNNKSSSGPSSSSKVKKQKSTDGPVVSSATCSSACSSTMTGAGRSTSSTRNETTSVSSSCPPSSSSSSSSSSSNRPCSSPKSDAKTYNAMLASAAASPPRFVAMEEIMKAASGVANMYLAHEIAVDDKFLLPDKSKNGNSSGSSSSASGSSGGGLKDRIEEMMRKAYWDILQSQLNDSPIVYKQAISLLIEIKEIILSLLLPQHTRLKQEIDEILDPDLIAQQAEHGTIDLPRYGQYILSVMARLCAPVRDDQIRQLTQTTDVVTLFKGIMDLLDLMKLDWANFSITAIRPHLQQQSIEYERKKFKEFMESQSKIQLVPGGADPLMYTRMWLSRNYQSLDLSDADETETREAGDRMVMNRVLAAAYTELLKWDDKVQDLPPETLLMDFNRFLTFRDKVKLYTLTGSVILVTFSTCGPSVQQLAEFKQTLKQHLFLILGEGNGNSSSDSTSVSSKLESAALQVSKEVKQVLETHGLPEMDESKRDLLMSQIRGLSDPNNRIRSVLERRMLEFVEGVTISSSATPVQIPSGLSVFSEELLTLTGQFIRLVNHNRAVFAEYYASIISDLRTSPAKPPIADDK